MSDNLVTVKEAAKILGVHWQTVRNFIKTGKLNSYKIGKSIRIKESDLLKISKDKKREDLLEVEIRFITNKRKIVEKKLLDLGAELIYHAHVIDHWFVPKEIKNIEQKNKLFDSGKGYGLRIREQDNGYTGKVQASLEIKRLLVPHKHEVCIEGEIDVANYKDTANLLKLMDNKEIITVDKDRVIYKIGKFKVVFDDVKGFKTAIEIEVKTTNNQAGMVKKVRNLAKKLGLDLESELTDTSATYMYMQKFARF